ncbi:hypothetical protein AB0K15_26545 [Amycolatopsis sp. NPDC049253]|uniref:hypothetical protein n=1 Tax=Amycolatopsis sp. NPDC049253 TaxID=3155274 RepID=UPI00343F628C
MAEPAPGRRTRWSRDDIVEAPAGSPRPSASTMRRAAREFGCSAIALSRHARDKDEPFRQRRPGSCGGDVVE